MLGAPKSRLLDLLKLRSSIFRTSFNPEGIRTGAKVLRRSLRGDLIKAHYYPSNLIPTPKKLNEMFPDLNCTDPKEHRRLAKNLEKRRKGKAPPKKLKGPREQTKGRKK